MVPGIAPSADPMLQARMFSYPDAARYRLGVNYQQLPTNLPAAPVYSPYQRDGAASIRGNYGPDPNYVRSTLRPVQVGTFQTGVNALHEKWIGEITAWTSEVVDADFEQAKGMWDVFGRTGQQENFVKNVSANLMGAKEDVREEAIRKFLFEMCRI